MTLRDKLLGFKGRIRRQDWWMLGLPVAFVQLVVTLTAQIIYATAVAPGDALYFLGYRLPYYVGLPIQLAFLWPMLSLSVQRFHDRNKSGWPVFAWYGAVYGPDYLPMEARLWLPEFEPSQREQIFFASVSIWTLIAIFFLIVLGFLDGTQGPHRFGPSPKGIGDNTLSPFD